MKKNFIALAVFAGLGVSACSHNPQTNQTNSQVPSQTQTQEKTTQQNAPKKDVPRALPLTQAPAAQRNATAKQRPVQLAQRQRPHRQQAQRRAPRALNIPVIKHQSRPQQQRRHAPQAKRALATPQNSRNVVPRLSRAELRAIGDQIFNNEGGGNIQNLAHWNSGEDFASMGIGHFTWYPANRRQTYGNTFPGLLDYLEENGVRLPAWLKVARHKGAPWRTRSEFFRAKDSRKMQQLQQLLYQTRELQAQYIVDRTRRAMPKLVKAADRNMQGRVARNLNAVANTPGGWYALIDYVNFKGEGLGNGGYKGQSWGLRQVLEEMRPSRPGQQALHEFSDAAMRVLQRRVRNSDPARNEKKWLPGWRNRVNTYRNPIA